jgi:hypothetical protein
MPSDRDPDLLLIERMLAPPPLDDARSSLDYWRGRSKSLPLYRRAARREAKEMATRWEERVRAAEQARLESSPVGKLLTALGLPTRWLRRVRVGKQPLFLLAWALVPLRLKLVASGLVALGLLLVVGGVTALAVVIDQLA